MISDDEGLREEYISREEIFKGKILHVVRDTVRLPDGKPATRELCLHVGGVAVLPLLPDGRVIVERQFRYPLGRVTVEIPAGKLNYAGEDREEAARRELSEETGAIAGRLTYIGDIVTSPALINEVISIYLAEEITLGERHPDDDEFLDIMTVPFDALFSEVVHGEIQDAKTVAATLRVGAILDERKNKRHSFFGG